MTTFDMPTVMNWLGAGAVGLIFGTISAWITYQFGRKRDNIAWEREKDKLQKQFDHSKHLLELQFQQKLRDLDQQMQQQKNTRLREELLRGIDNPNEVIHGLKALKAQMEHNATFGYFQFPVEVLALPFLNRLELILNEQGDNHPEQDPKSRV